MQYKPWFRKKVFKMLHMAYHMPETLPELSEALAKNDSKTAIIAGSTDFMIKYRNHPERFNRIIDLSGLLLAKGICEHKEWITIGALVTHTEIEESALIKKYFPALAIAAGQVGSTQIRNRGTIAGNIANASPCADTVPPLMAYEATLKIVNGKGELMTRTVDEVLVGMGKNTLAMDEVILEIEIPKEKAFMVSAFSKLGSRKAVSISKLNLCIGLDIGEKEMITKAHVCVGSLGPKAFRVPEVENLCTGQSLNSEFVEKLAEAMSMAVEKAIKGRGSMSYKRRAIKGLVEDVLNDLFKAHYRGIHQYSEAHKSKSGVDYE